MKKSLLGAGFVLGVALSGAAIAAEATDADAKSGAADSTVLTPSFRGGSKPYCFARTSSGTSLVFSEMPTVL